MQKVWLKHYPKGTPENIDPNIFTSLVELAETSYQKYANLPAFSCMGASISYRELEKKAREFASYLLGPLQLQKGDRVAIMLPNILQYPIALHGILAAGLTVVNVNPLYTPRELEHQLNDSGAKAIVVLENFAHVLEKVVKKTPIQKVILTQLGDMLGLPKSLLVNLVVKHVKKLVPPFKISNAVSFFEALDSGRRVSVAFPKVQPEDLAFLQYTGGTTGLSKGAMLTHRNMVANIEQAYAWIQSDLKDGGEHIVTALPMYHIFSLMANCLCFMKIGGHNILIPNPRDIAGFIKELKKHRFTAITGVNTLFNALMHHNDFSSIDFSHLRLTLGGGMAVQKAVAERWQKVTGCTLLQAYGLTEASPAVCINPLNSDNFSGSIGVPLPSTLVTIRDENDQEVALGESGELCVKGPQVMRGYWNRPDETANVITSDGWLKTGDVAVVDELGYFTIVDRKKDMILVSGFNVYPNEIEDVLAQHTGLAEVAAVGVQDEKSGEVVKVYAVRKDPKVTGEEVINFCKQYLTGYKVPKYVEFRDELPKTNVGKILRRALRDGAPSSSP